MTDVPYSLWIIVLGANLALAITVARKALTAGRIAGVRTAPVAWAIGVWFAVAVAAGCLGAYESTADQRVPLIGLGIVAPIVAGAWWLRPRGPRGDVVDAVPLAWLIGIQLYRVIGAVFVVAWLIDRMPWQFALPAGIGDVLVGLAAPIVAYRVVNAPARSRPIATAWILLGLADLVVAISMGLLTAPSVFQQLAFENANSLISRFPFVLIPTFAVPLSVILHLAALHGLRTTTVPGQPKHRTSATPS